MYEGSADSAPAHEPNAEAYQKVKRSVEQGSYTTLIGTPDVATPIVDRLANELAQTRAIMRLTVPEAGKDYPAILSDIIRLAPEAARSVVSEDVGLSMNFSSLMEKTTELSQKPVVAIIENLQHVTFARDDLIRVVRALANERAINKELRKLTFLLVADQHPSDLLEDIHGTPYNIGTNIYI